jgi:hypothetical protein
MQQTTHNARHRRLTDGELERYIANEKHRKSIRVTKRWFGLINRIFLIARNRDLARSLLDWTSRWNGLGWHRWDFVSHPSEQKQTGLLRELASGITNIVKKLGETIGLLKTIIEWCEFITSILRLVVQFVWQRKHFFGYAAASAGGAFAASNFHWPGNSTESIDHNVPEAPSEAPWQALE